MIACFVLKIGIGIEGREIWGEKVAMLGSKGYIAVEFLAKFGNSVVKWISRFCFGLSRLIL